MQIMPFSCTVCHTGTMPEQAKWNAQSHKAAQLETAEPGLTSRLT